MNCHEVIGEVLFHKTNIGFAERLRELI